MMDFPQMTKAVLATCFITGMTLMSSADGAEFYNSRYPAPQNGSACRYNSTNDGNSQYGSSIQYRHPTDRSNDYISSTYGRASDNQLRDPGLNCTGGQCRFSGNHICKDGNCRLNCQNGRCGLNCKDGKCGQLRDLNWYQPGEYNRDRNDDYRLPPIPSRDFNSESPYRQSPSSYRLRETDDRDRTDRYRDDFSRFPSAHQRDNDFRNRDDYSNRSQDRFEYRTNETRYRNDRPTDRLSRDRLIPVTYETQRSRPSNQGRSPFYE